MTEPKVSKRRKPGQKENEELIAVLAKAFQETPDDVWSMFPEIAAKLDERLTPKRSPSNAESLHYYYLGERERDYRLKMLISILEKWKNTGISKEEAVEALESAATLREEAASFKDTLLVLLEKVLQFPLIEREERTMYFQKGKPEHHTFTLARGIVLSLTWDRKLIKISFDPREYSLRQKALSFVGAGSDTDSDVARRHDFYLEDAFGR